MGIQGGWLRKPCGPGSESAEQKALFDWWGLYSKRWPGVLMFAVPNGGARTAATGSRLRAEGVHAGIPDIFLAAPRAGRHGLFIELKRRDGGRVSQAQRESMEALESQGYACVVCRGFSEAREACEAYLEERDGKDV